MAPRSTCTFRSAAAVYLLRLQHTYHAQSQHRAALHPVAAQAEFDLYLRHLRLESARNRRAASRGRHAYVPDPGRTRGAARRAVRASPLRADCRGFGRGRSARDDARAAGSARALRVLVVSASGCRTLIRASRTSSIVCRARHRYARSRQAARALGYDSVNFDLIYGLPLQTRRASSDDRKRAAGCGRIASRSMAMRTFPGSSPGSDASPEVDLPAGRREAGPLRARAASVLDTRATARSAWITSRSRRQPLAGLRSRHPASQFHGLHHLLHVSPLIGLGVSAIGDAGDAFAQNEKDRAALSGSRRARVNRRFIAAICSMPRTRCCAATSCD